MIPVKLSLHNFMCYRDNVSPLYFDGIHLACLCGHNGHGKSALLDAITWALWGESRAKSDDELIHLGRSEMAVEFDFRVDKEEYRVLRKRAKTKLERTGQTLLDFQVNTREGFRSISGNSIVETQQNISRILHMDYLTFINSAFLRQGHADEFTIKAPGERKKVLADILRLSLYNGLEERAKGQVKAKEQQQRVLESSMEEMRQEIESKEEYGNELAEVRKTLAELEKEVHSQESQVVTLREAKKDKDFKQEQLIEQEKAVGQVGEELDRWRSQYMDHNHKVEEYEKVLQRSSEVEEGYARLQKVRKENEGLNRKLEASFELTKRKEQLVQAVNEAKGNLLEERGRVQNRVEELETKSKTVTRLQEELVGIQAKLSKIAEEEEDLNKKKNRAREITLQLQQWKSDNAQLEQAVKELEDKLDLLTQGEDKCPLCETDLGIQGKQRIEEKYEVEVAEKIDAKIRNESKLKGKIEEQRTIEQEVSQWEVRINKERMAWHRQKAASEKEISLNEKAGIELVKAKERLMELEERLARGDFASAKQQSLKEVGQEISDLKYDSGKHQKVQQLLTELEKYEGWRRNMEEAERSLSSERAVLNQTREAMDKWESTLKRHKEKVIALNSELAAVSELVNKLVNAEQSFNLLRQKQTEVRDRMLAIQEKIARCSELERKKKEKDRFLLQILKEKSIYEELVDAFGKKGIQAFLMESAIPEIEDEANRLLSRMTDNRMQVNIETQRETKKGETIETLEIKITDELGRRDYEMYSGGEAFCIDFALRIALSKLLAHRAGAPLPILFIDEGFGTQDSNGLDKLVEVINSIQEDFEKIIVITHLEELKSAFPVRIEVTKTDEGSIISLS